MEENQEKKLTNEEETKDNPNQEQNIETKNEETHIEEQENKSETSLVECKKKKKRKGSYIIGTIGALFGGVVILIPWIIRYLFARRNFPTTLLSMLSTILLPFGTYLGYKIFNGKIRKPCLKINALVSIGLIMIFTLILCPIALIIEAEYPVNFENWISLFSDLREDARSLIVEDAIAGISLTIIGIIFSSKNIKRQIDKLLTEQEKIDLVEKPKEQLREKAEILKKTCVTLNCMNKENAKKKKIILKELKSTYNIKRRKAKQYFSVCKIAKFLKRYKGKYYYDENDHENKIENTSKINSRYKLLKTIKFVFKLIITAAILAVITTGIIILVKLNMKTHYKIPNTDIELAVNSYKNLYGTQEEIAKEFGQQIALSYDFIITDKDETYEMEGIVVDKKYYEGTDINAIIQSDREYCLQVTNEEMSEISDIKLGSSKFKTYYYHYNGNNNARYLAVVYLHEAKENYLWIFAYADTGVEVEKINKELENMLK